jgi:hypothetical protein
MKRAIVGLLLCVSSGFVACDSGDSTSSAEKGCNTFVSAVCDRTLECSAASGQSVSRSECLDTLRDVMKCDATVQLGATFAECLAAVPSLDCNKLLSGDPTTLPASCAGVIQTN